MKTRTENKIVLCQNCYGVLTPGKILFCDPHCAGEYARTEDWWRGTKAIWVYCNKNLLDLAVGNKCKAIAFSMFLWSGHELVCVAKFEETELEKIGDKEANAYDAWWREIGRLNTSIEPHQPRVMREEGLQSYLCDRFEISTEKNIALAIGEITVIEGLSSPLELFNTL